MSLSIYCYIITMTIIAEVCMNKMEGKQEQDKIS